MSTHSDDIKDSDGWRQLQARFQTERVRQSTYAALDAFTAEAVDVRPDRLYEAYAVSLAEVALRHYADLVREVGRPEAFTDETRTDFLRACADRVGMPEIARPLDQLEADARRAALEPRTDPDGPDF